MTVVELLSYLRGQGMDLWVDGDRLHYSAPKGVLTGDLRAELGERKAELVEFLREASTTEPSPRTPIRTVSRIGNLPLSFAQQQLWLLHQLDPSSASYNVPQAIRMSGELNLAALKQAIEGIGARHEILRTTFPAVEGSPVQAISPRVNVTLPVIDLSNLPETQLESETLRLMTEEARRPFDLACSPLLRTNLLRLRDCQHVLLVTMHHIVSDAWSMRIFFRELAALYEAFSIGKPSPQPMLPVQYADFALWQRERLRGEVLEKQLVYWKQQLCAAPVELELPTDHPRPTVQGFRGATQPLELRADLSEALKILSRREGATLFMTLLAALQTLLHRYTGQQDVVVGSPTATRDRAETEQLIGFFVNTLVLRTDLSGDPTFLELLGRVKQVVLGALSHRDLPFERLVEELRPERDLSRNPLFNVMFVLHNDPTPAPELLGLTSRFVEVETGTAKFDLTVSLLDTEQRLSGVLQYNTDLFNPPTITRMRGHLQTLLEGISANPERRLSELPLLRETERHQLLVQWNDTRRDYPRHRCVHELFEAQVERTPDAVALVFQNQRLTYGELNRRANQLAHYLQKRGVGPEVRVGICMERSTEMVVALLGALKAGGAYVPLDPAYPRERMAFMLEDAQVQVLLTQQHIIKTFRQHRVPVVFLDAAREAVSKESQGNPVSGAGAENLAYVMYTSGSTGRPKGTEIVHRGIVRLLFGVDYARLGESEVFLQLAPVSFDASTLEIWGGLLHGARCVLFPGTTATAHELGDVLRKQKVSTLWLTASLFNTVIDEAPEVLSPVRQLLVGGEALSVPHVRRALELLPATTLINGYGPTEGTTFTCCYPVPRAVDKFVSSIPIGRPIGNTQVYILDRHLRPVPVGVAGELHIGGDGLARGYLNRPELTAEKFIANPFSQEAGARLYKTGDLARYRPDGNIEFLGRLDDQVKIRGFRVELGEIEAVLSQHRGVREAVVVAREDTPGEKRLVAYVVTNQGQGSGISQLRLFLQEKLPEYMLPSQFIFLESLPRMSSGKVDRRGLPLPRESASPPPGESVAPRNTLESQLAEIWEKVLGTHPISIRDNFFDLGGHSLLVVKLLRRIEQAFGISLSMAAVFQSPTVERMAAVLGGQSSLSPLQRIVPIQEAGARPPFFCVGAGPLFRSLAKRLGADQPFLGVGLQISELSQLETPYRLEDIARYVVKAMREAQPKGPYFLGGWCHDGVLAYETARQLLVQGESVALLALLDAQNPAYRESSLGCSRFELLAQRLGFHLSNLRQLQISEALPYVLDRLKEVVRKVRRTFWQTSYRLRRRRGGSRLQNTDQMLYVATMAYHPQPYAGRAALFQAAKRPSGRLWDLQIGWRELVLGGLEVHEIPGDHSSFLRGSNVEILANEMNACLRRARELEQSGIGQRVVPMA